MITAVGLHADNLRRELCRTARVIRRGLDLRPGLGSAIAENLEQTPAEGALRCSLGDRTAGRRVIVRS